MNQSQVHISIVSPVYKAENIVAELVKEIEKNVSMITADFEIILVNDCSPDKSWEKIKTECHRNSKVKALHLSKNFGQHYAITAGLNYAKGDWIIVMDCDLQDRPDEIPNLYRKAIEGWDVVHAIRVNRQDSFFKKISSKIFYLVFNYLSGLNANSNYSNYGIYHKKVIAEYNKLPELSRDFLFLINNLGFKTTAISVKHSERFEGSSSYTLMKLLKLSTEVIISNSNKPLKSTVKLGVLISLLSIILAIYNIVAKLIGVIDIAGYTTTVFSIWFLGGLILFVLGIIGIYIGKIYDQVKGRHLYIVSKTINT